MRRSQQNLSHIFLTFGLFSMNFETWMNGQVHKLRTAVWFFFAGHCQTQRREVGRCANNNQRGEERERGGGLSPAGVTLEWWQGRVWLRLLTEEKLESLG
jgi:hypothetical protein